MRILICLFMAAALAGCSSSQFAEEHPSKKERVKAGAKNVGHKTEYAARKVGGKLQKFFRGEDTISR